MSKRHEVSRSTSHGTVHAAPTKQERRATNRKARHRTHEILQRADAEVGEDIVTPRPKHTTVDVGPEVTTPETGGDARPSREYRHWKQKFWKRRKSERMRKAELVLHPVED